MKVKFYKSESFNERNLKHVYDVCNKLFKDEECFYTSDELKKIKQDKTNVFFNV